MKIKLPDGLELEFEEEVLNQICTAGRLTTKILHIKIDAIEIKINFEEL
jgi:hypothetical protein